MVLNFSEVVFGRVSFVCKEPKLAKCLMDTIGATFVAEVKPAFDDVLNELPLLGLFKLGNAASQPFTGICVGYSEKMPRPVGHDKVQQLIFVMGRHLRTNHQMADSLAFSLLIATRNRHSMSDQSGGEYAHIRRNP
ncbi:MAG: hypothetical protein ACRBB0_12130 [Pelagimonas sp.]|uniref:hypothetical protein n=1 Tax=Pelagimonas sp. TaxID=2073170 RepID=UPI003D6BEB90